MFFLPQIREDMKNSPSDSYRSLENEQVNTQNEQHKFFKDSPFNLPSILLTNLQSFGKPGSSDKTTELELVLEVNNIDIGVFTETWATDSTLVSLEFENYTKFHLVRKNCLRPSGGISIFVDINIPATKLDVHVPCHLEIMYVSIRPSRLPRSVSNIVLCTVYYPGSKSLYAPPQEDIIIHLTESIQSFKNEYSNPLIILLGDFNDLNIIDLCEICLLKQVVEVPTRNDAILDLIMTNLDNDLYKDPVTLPKIGNSDHLCVLYVPKDYVKKENLKKKIMPRKFKKSAIIAFGSWITKFDWSILFQIKDVNQKVLYFATITWLMVEECFPLQKIIISSTDKEWMTPKIKDLISQRQKAHKAKNFELKNYLDRKIKHEIRKAKENFNSNKAHLFHMSNPREWYKHINKIIGNKRNNLIFTNVPDVAYKPIGEQIKIVNNHFANICNKYPPLNKNLVIKGTPCEDAIASISEFSTYKLLIKYSKKSLGHGDLPKKILQEFAPELATPFCDIINCALKTNIFPDAYKKAEIVPIPKVNPPPFTFRLKTYFENTNWW